MLSEIPAGNLAAAAEPAHSALELAREVLEEAAGQGVIPILVEKAAMAAAAAPEEAQPYLPVDKVILQVLAAVEEGQVLEAPSLSVLMESL